MRSPLSVTADLVRCHPEHAGDLPVDVDLHRRVIELLLELQIAQR